MGWRGVKMCIDRWRCTKVSLNKQGERWRSSFVIVEHTHEINDPLHCPLQPYSIMENLLKHALQSMDMLPNNKTLTMICWEAKCVNCSQTSFSPQGVYRILSANI